MDIKIQLFLILVSEFKGSPNKGGYLLRWVPLLEASLISRYI